MRLVVICSQGQQGMGNGRSDERLYPRLWRRLDRRVDRNHWPQQLLGARPQYGGETTKGIGLWRFLAMFQATDGFAAQTGEVSQLAEAQSAALTRLA